MVFIDLSSILSGAPIKDLIMTLQQKVREAYVNALANGVNLDLKTPEAVAVDMLTLDADLENETLETVKECVIQIQKQRLLQG